MSDIVLVNANSLSIPLADKSVQMVATSPPYWHQRDYGTAEWEGGDSECDHKVGRFEYPVSKKQASNSGSAGHQARHVCPKCGAVRKDKQLGQEDQHDCLGWATGDIWELRSDLTDEEVIYVYRELVNAGVLSNGGEQHDDK